MTDMFGDQIFHSNLVGPHHKSWITLIIFSPEYFLMKGYRVIEVQKPLMFTELLQMQPQWSRQKLKYFVT